MQFAPNIPHSTFDGYPFPFFQEYFGEYREQIKASLKDLADNGFNFAMIRAAMASVADTSIIMMPDLLGLGSEARINAPATLGDNWLWRIDGVCINDWLAKIVADLTEIYGR